MTMTYNTLYPIQNELEALADKTLPFKLSMIIAKNLSAIKKEIDFYTEQERAFAEKFLEVDENGMYVQEGEGAFRIKEGLYEECRQAREDLDNFQFEINLIKLPVVLLENIPDITPNTLIALESIIEEEE